MYYISYDVVIDLELIVDYISNVYYIQVVIVEQLRNQCFRERTRAY